MLHVRTKKVIRDTNGDPIVISISDGQASASVNVVMPADASKDSRFVITALDFNEVYGASGQACIINAVTSGNLQGISQCANSENQYELAFGSDALQRCVVNNGGPCKSNNHGASCGQEQMGGLTEAEKAACGYNPLYDDDYGCLMCTLDTNSTCSSDNFAIRPDIFDISTSDVSYPDLLRAGEDYNLKIYAYDNGVNSGAVTTNNYNVANADTNLTITQTLLLKDKTPAAGGELNGVFSWSGNFDMLNGKSTDGVTEEAAGVNFTDIGNVILRVEDRTWAAVDINDVNNVNDATTHDCSGAYACGESNATFIPDHFSFTNPTITNSNGNPGSFTYISNLDPSDTSTYTVAVRVLSGIEARNKNDNIVQNFKTGANYYENPVTVNISLNDSTHGNADTTAIDNILLGFGKDNGDANGTKSLVWADSNMTKVLRFNFPRTVNTPMNPFDVNGTDLNITLESSYTGTAPAGNALVVNDNTGIGTAIGTPTMLYGRSHASRQRYVGATGIANIYYESYCFKTDIYATACDKNLLPDGVSSKRTNDLRWYINPNHTANDGNAGSVIEKDSIGKVTPAGSTSGNHLDNSTLMTYDESQGYPYKTTMENNASNWLIYNEDDATATMNQFSVEFEGVSTGWSGAHETNTTTKDVAAPKTNRRSMW